MARDIRELFKNEKNLSDQKMPEGHEDRFMEKLGEEQNTGISSKPYMFLRIAASFVILLGLGYGAFQFMDKSGEQRIDLENNDKQTAMLKSLGDVSPALKKVEDYYMANINLELSSVEVNENNKELFDGYILRLEELNDEYKRLSKELTEQGPNELTINALIDNLKFRLNLLYRFKEQLQQLDNTELKEKNNNI